jgi:glutamyl-tRNA reductase
MRLLLLGINHRTAPLELRERVAFGFEQARRATETLRQQLAEELVILSTCNRSELYVVPAEPGEGTFAPFEEFFTRFFGVAAEMLDGCLYRRRDLEAVEHLFRVAAGLDSMVLGEAEILGQVRQAYRQAVLWGSTGPVLDRIFQAAIDTGKRVRAETELGQRPISIASVGLQLAHRVFSDFRHREALVVGSGEMAQQVAEQLVHRGVRSLWMVSSHPERATVLANRLGARAVSWEELPGLIARPDIIVSATQVEQPVLSRRLLAEAMEQRHNRPLFVLDLGVPRNVEASAAELYNLYLYNLDDLSAIVEENRRAREQEIPRAEAVVAEQLGKLTAWLASANSEALLASLEQHLEQMRQQVLVRHAAHLAQMPPQARALVDALTRELLDGWLSAARRNLHRARTWRQKLERLESLRELFGLDRDHQ